MLRHPHADGDSTMELRTTSVRLWLGSAAILASLLLAAPVAARNQDDQGQNNNDQGTKKIVRTPEPATLALIALGGGALALARSRQKSRKKN